MLHAYKRDIRTELSKQLVNLRQSELDYYVTNIREIGTQSALLAGFAFTILAGHSSSNTLYSLYQYTADQQRSSAFVILDREWLRRDLGDGREMFQVAIELVYLVSTASGKSRLLCQIGVDTAAPWRCDERVCSVGLVDCHCPVLPRSDSL